jgi:outer membrane protein assembly complex protein YaeT
VLCCVIAAACHDDHGVRVAAINFEGAETYSAADLRRIIETRVGGRWPWSRWKAFDEAVFERDLDRIRAFYRDRGFDEAIVRVADVDLAEDGKTVRLSIAIDEGAPLLVSSVIIEGLDDLEGREGVPPGVLARLKALDPGVGKPRDVTAFTELRDTALALLRDNGHPHASLEIVEEPGPEPRTLVARVRITTGPETRFGDLQMNGLSRTKQVVVWRAVTFDPGDLYRESEVLKSQRRLNQIGAFEFAHLAPVAEAKDGKAAVLPMVATIAEARPNRFEVGVGYGTEDRLRAAFEWRNVNFFGNGSEWVGNARYSTVLRGAGFGYDHPYLLPSGGTLDARAGAWWTNETTFSSRTAGGHVGLTHSFGAADAIRVRTRYRNEYLTYRVTDAVLADLTTVEERIALGLDPVTGRGDGTIAGFELSAGRSVVDNPLDPSRGLAVSASAEHVAPWLGGSFRYDEVAAEARGYVPIGSRLRFAGKVRYGTLSANTTADVPFSERFFLGGSTNLRGWGRFEVSPTSIEGVPIGGRTFVDTSVEARIDVCCGVGVVGFLDAGNVWSEDWRSPFGSLQRAVGGGLRYESIVGVIRADVGYQLNPIAGLRLDGQPQKRRWRIHLSIGHAF